MGEGGVVVSVVRWEGPVVIEVVTLVEGGVKVLTDVVMELG